MKVLDRLARWWISRRYDHGYVMVSAEMVGQYELQASELEMFKRHLSHRWQVRIHNRDSQERALQNLQQLGLTFDDEVVHENVREAIYEGAVGG